MEIATHPICVRSKPIEARRDASNSHVDLPCVTDHRIVKDHPIRLPSRTRVCVSCVTNTGLPKNTPSHARHRRAAAARTDDGFLVWPGGEAVQSRPRPAVSGSVDCIVVSDEPSGEAGGLTVAPEMRNGADVALSMPGQNVVAHAVARAPT